MAHAGGLAATRPGCGASSLVRGRFLVARTAYSRRGRGVRLGAAGAVKMPGAYRLEMAVGANAAARGHSAPHRQGHHRQSDQRTDASTPGADYGETSHQEVPKSPRSSYQILGAQRAFSQREPLRVRHRFRCFQLRYNVTIAATGGKKKAKSNQTPGGFSKPAFQTTSITAASDSSIQANIAICQRRRIAVCMVVFYIAAHEKAAIQSEPLPHCDTRFQAEGVGSLFLPMTVLTVCELAEKDSRPRVCLTPAAS